MLDTDPNIITARRNIEAKLAVVEASRAQKTSGWINFMAVLKTLRIIKGLALSVDASRLVLMVVRFPTNLALLDAEAADKVYLYR